ncbi:Universal stress protein UspA [Burkholderia latens]|uniref:universal stress protein n=1 Tax=Burkholderia latens TaxID=488446 RepID=UPI0039A653B2
MYSNILVALDGSDTSSGALDAALNLASVTGARLTPVYVVDFLVPAYDTYGYNPSIRIDAFREEGLRVMEDAAKRMKARDVAGTPQISNVAPAGEDVAQRIVRLAGEIDADLIVIGTRGWRGFQRLFLGSVAERVLRQAACPVLMIPGSCAGNATEETTVASTEKEPS